jgi:hypothetical protein
MNYEYGQPGCRHICEVPSEYGPIVNLVIEDGELIVVTALAGPCRVVMLLDGTQTVEPL